MVSGDKVLVIASQTAASWLCSIDDEHFRLVSLDDLQSCSICHLLLSLAKSQQAPADKSGAGFPASGDWRICGEQKPSCLVRMGSGVELAGEGVRAALNLMLKHGLREKSGLWG